MKKTVKLTDEQAKNYIELLKKENQDGCNDWAAAYDGGSSLEPTEKTKTRPCDTCKHDGQQHRPHGTCRATGCGYFGQSSWEARDEDKDELDLLIRKPEATMLPTEWLKIIDKWKERVKNLELNQEASISMMNAAKSEVIRHYERAEKAEARVKELEEKNNSLNPIEQEEPKTPTGEKFTTWLKNCIGSEFTEEVRKTIRAHCHWLSHLNYLDYLDAREAKAQAESDRAERNALIIELDKLKNS
jgi:hypothetical protein